MLTHHAEPNRADLLAADAIRCCIILAHGGGYRMGSDKDSMDVRVLSAAEEEDEK